MIRFTTRKPKVVISYANDEAGREVILLSLEGRFFGRRFLLDQSQARELVQSLESALKRGGFREWQTRHRAQLRPEIDA